MVYILLAEGFEETEMIAPLDILKRAGADVLTVGITGDRVKGAHGVEMTADILPYEVNLADIDSIILPGGMPGTLNLKEDAFVEKFIKRCAEDNKLIGAICAAPMILGEMGLLKGKKAVCFPGFEEHLIGAEVLDTPVACDGNIITAKGAGAALLFGAALTDYLKGAGEGKKILDQMQTP